MANQPIPSTVETQFASRPAGAAGRDELIGVGKRLTVDQKSVRIKQLNGRSPHAVHVPFKVPSDLGESAVEGAHFVGTIARSYVTLDAEVFRARTGGGTEVVRR